MASIHHLLLAVHTYCTYTAGGNTRSLAGKQSETTRWLAWRYTLFFMKIIDLELCSADLEATKRFYVRRLCLPMISHPTTHVTVLVGWTRLTFGFVNQPVAPYHLAINVPRGSLEVLM